MEELKKLRDRIDFLDSQLALLLNERMKASEQVGKIKRGVHIETHDFSREAKVVEQVESQTTHPILQEHIADIYQDIMTLAKMTQRFYDSSSQPFRKIGIIGHGLMGGSISKALKTKDRAIEIGILDPSCDDGLSSIKEMVEFAELIILASPIPTIIPYAEEISRHRPIEKVIVIDVASVKADIVAAFGRLTSDHIEFCSTHPMAGHEMSGLTHSRKTLFVNRPWAIVPHPKNLPITMQKIESWIHYLGAHAIKLSAEEHDLQTALISHFPALLSKNYLDFVRSRCNSCEQLSGPGFESFTRLARDNPLMHAEIQKHNKANLLALGMEWLAQLQKKLENLS